MAMPLLAKMAIAVLLLLNLAASYLASPDDRPCKKNVDYSATIAGPHRVKRDYDNLAARHLDAMTIDKKSILTTSEDSIVNGTAREGSEKGDDMSTQGQPRMFLTDVAKPVPQPSRDAAPAVTDIQLPQDQDPSVGLLFTPKSGALAFEPASDFDFSEEGPLSELELAGIFQYNSKDDFNMEAAEDEQMGDGDEGQPSEVDNDADEGLELKDYAATGLELLEFNDLDALADEISRLSTAREGDTKDEAGPTHGDHDEFLAQTDEPNNKARNEAFQKAGDASSATPANNAGREWNEKGLNGNSGNNARNNGYQAKPQSKTNKKLQSSSTPKQLLERSKNPEGNNSAKRERLLITEILQLALKLSKNGSSKKTRLHKTNSKDQESLLDQLRKLLSGGKQTGRTNQSVDNDNETVPDAPASEKLSKPRRGGQGRNLKARQSATIDQSRIREVRALVTDLLKTKDRISTKTSSRHMRGHEIINKVKEKRSSGKQTSVSRSRSPNAWNTRTQVRLERTTSNSKNEGALKQLFVISPVDGDKPGAFQLKRIRLV